MAPLYCIVFMGELVPGRDAEAITATFAARCRMTPQRARELILGGGRSVLKCGLDPEEAQRYSSELREIGLLVELEPEGRMPAAGQSLEIDLDRTIILAKRAAVDDNPYAAPQADLVSPAIGWSGEGLRDPRPVSAGRGWDWIVAGWELFKDRPWAWVGVTLLYLLISIVLNFLPFIGGLVMAVLGPILSGGLMIGAHSQYQGGGFEVKHLFAGFERQPGPLALVGAASLGFALLLVLVIVLFGMLAAFFLAGQGSMGSMGSMGGMNHGTFDPAQMWPVLILPVLVMLLLGILLGMAFLFAPALVALNEVPVLRAFKLSFQGCWRNILPFLVFGLIALALSLVCLLTLGLGLLVLMPVLIIATYMAYRDIYYD